MAHSGVTALYAASLCGVRMKVCKKNDCNAPRHPKMETYDAARYIRGQKRETTYLAPDHSSMIDEVIVMADQNGATKKRETLDLSRLPDEITGRAREIWLAGLGALSRLEEEGDKVFSDLVKRGEAYEGKRRAQLDEATQNLRSQQEKLSENVTSRFENVQKTVEKTVSDTLSGALGRVGVPTRDEVRGLSQKVGELSTKLDALASMLDAQEAVAEAEPAAATETATLLVVPHDDGWAVMQDGAEPALSIHETKKDAISAGREAAKAKAPSELIVHKQDGSVQDSFSYDENA